MSREARRSSKHMHIQANATTTRELFTRMVGLNFQNAVAQLLLQQLLSLLQTQQFLLCRTNS